MTLDQQIKETQELIDSMKDKDHRDHNMLTVCEQLLGMVKELAKGKGRKVRRQGERKDE